MATNTPITAVANSGPEDPAAIKVAPATSGGMLRTKKTSFIVHFRKGLQGSYDFSFCTFSNFVKGWNEVVIANNGQANKHVNGNTEMNDDTASLSVIIVH